MYVAYLYTLLTNQSACKLEAEVASVFISVQYLIDLIHSVVTVCLLKKDKSLTKGSIHNKTSNIKSSPRNNHLENTIETSWYNLLYFVEKKNPALFNSLDRLLGTINCCHSRVDASDETTPKIKPTYVVFKEG